MAEIDEMPLLSRTPAEWARSVLAEPMRLLVDHAFLEKKAASNALELLTRWPNEWLDGWVETMTGVARMRRRIWRRSPGFCCGAAGVWTGSIRILMPTRCG